VCSRIPTRRLWTTPHPDEERFVTLGLDFLGRVVVVVWTSRDDEIRIISARGATRRERGQYEE
jgi:uncharacterized DUF497 family protein